jgi:hypothetical protein
MDRLDFEAGGGPEGDFQGAGVGGNAEWGVIPGEDEFLRCIGFLPV